MGLRLPDGIDSMPPSGEIRVDNVRGRLQWDVADLPYYTTALAGRIERLTTASPRQVWYVAASVGDKPAGLLALHRALDRPEVAGIYDCGVIPSTRRTGVGSALVRAAGRLATELDCRLLVLNSTESGLPLYRHLGFQSAGRGRIWRLPEETLNNAPPSSLVQFVQAIAFGDGSAVDQLARTLTLDVLRSPLACGMSPMQLAAAFNQPASASQLEAHGAAVDLMSAWDLGWKERAKSLMAEHPESVNARHGPLGATPLHIAAERNDAELARLTLSGCPDPTIPDTRCGASARAWAQHFGSKLVQRLIDSR
jgi:GNAT superfamily N-acetyltransferase